MPPAYQAALKRGAEAFVIALVAVSLVVAVATIVRMNAAEMTAGAAALAGAIKALVQFFEVLRGTVVVPSTPPSTSNPTAAAQPQEITMTLIQELGVAEVVFTDIESFAAGQPVTVSPTIDGYKVTDTVTKAGATAPAGYQVFSGSVLSIILAVFADAMALQSGAPIQIAEKIGNTWYGHAITVAKAA